MTSAAPRALSRTFNGFFDSERAGGFLLVLCTALSICAANSPWGVEYSALWRQEVGGLSLSGWINDGLMAIFFLLIGLELERELYSGELATFRTAILPILAALGGVCVPAAIYYVLNRGTPTASGVGIPMATDIAFAMAALSLLGTSVPAALRVFLVALAVIDDLIAIIVIAIFYSTEISTAYILAAGVVFTILVVLNRPFRVMAFTPYLLGGALMWFFMLKSGVHATIAGVLLAFAIPFSAKPEDERSPSHRLEHLLQKPVAFLILPLFALANTGIVFQSGWYQGLLTEGALGIMMGLIVGKPAGIGLAAYAAVLLRIARLPAGVRGHHILGAGLLGGIGFTMSIFIGNLAFPEHPELINASIIAILAGSLVAASLGVGWLWVAGRTAPPDR